jgi:predicted RNase H-like HicB family nuclease
VKDSPFEYQRQGSPREFSAGYGEGLYVDQGFELAIFGMKMRRIVIIEVHSNHDPKESRHLGHFCFDSTLGETFRTGMPPVFCFWRTRPIGREHVESSGISVSGGSARQEIAGIIEIKKPMRYTVILEREEDGGYIATVPALLGCVSQGDSRPEVMRNIREAADVYIEDCIAFGDPVPTEAGREYLELETSIP